VPDRLTYLAGARSLPSQILRENWSRGDEWRDWFVTGLGIQRFEMAVDETIMDRIDQHLQNLYQAEQAMLYRALLRPPEMGGVDEELTLFEETRSVTNAKMLILSQLSLYYSDYLFDSDAARTFLLGTQSLVDETVLRRFRESNVAIKSINDTGLARFESLVSFWDRQSETLKGAGSPAVTVAHAIARLDSLYREFFQARSSRSEGEAVRVPSG
jgi:hypothetical protein